MRPDLEAQYMQDTPPPRTIEAPLRVARLTRRVEWATLIKEAVLDGAAAKGIDVSALTAKNKNPPPGKDQGAAAAGSGGGAALPAGK